jgi:hypothetical protein
MSQYSWSLHMHFDIACIEFAVLKSAMPPPNQMISQFVKPGLVGCNHDLIQLIEQPTLYCKSIAQFILVSKSSVHSPCSLELISTAYQPLYSVFLSQEISEQYFQPWLLSQANVQRENKWGVHFSDKWGVHFSDRISVLEQRVLDIEYLCYDDVQRENTERVAMLESAAASFEWRPSVENSIASVRAELDGLIKRVDRSVSDPASSPELVAGHRAAGESTDWPKGHGASPTT